MGKVKRVKAPQELGIEAFLAKRNLERVEVVNDGSCLFRAVAFQHYGTQEKHKELREVCISYIKNNIEDFKEFLSGNHCAYLEKLSSLEFWGGEPEIVALNRILRRTIVIYKEEQSGKVSEKIYREASIKGLHDVKLIFIDDQHYDCAMKKGWTKTAGFCQALLYEELFKKVLQTDIPTTKSLSKMLERKDEEALESASEKNSIVFTRGLLQALSQDHYCNTSKAIYETNKRAQETKDHSLALAIHQESVLKEGEDCEVKYTDRWMKGQIKKQLRKKKYIVYVPEISEEVTVGSKDLKWIDVRAVTSDSEGVKDKKQPKGDGQTGHSNSSTRVKQSKIPSKDSELAPEKDALKKFQKQRSQDGSLTDGKRQNQKQGEKDGSLTEGKRQHQKQGERDGSLTEGKRQNQKQGERDGSLTEGKRQNQKQGERDGSLTEGKRQNQKQGERDGSLTEGKRQHQRQGEKDGSLTEGKRQHQKQGEQDGSLTEGKRQHQRQGERDGSLTEGKRQNQKQGEKDSSFTEGKRQHQRQEQDGSLTEGKRQHLRQGEQDGSLTEGKRQHQRQGEQDGNIVGKRQYQRQGEQDGNFTEGKRQHQRQGEQDGSLTEGKRQYQRQGEQDGSFTEGKRQYQRQEQDGSFTEGKRQYQRQEQDGSFIEGKRKYQRQEQDGSFTEGKRQSLQNRGGNYEKSQRQRYYETTESTSSGEKGQLRGHIDQSNGSGIDKRHQQRVDGPSTASAGKTSLSNTEDIQREGRMKRGLTNSHPSSQFARALPQEVSSPAQPIRSPAQPVSSPAQPIRSPAQPVSSPAQPIRSPAQPVSLPAQPIRSPAQPVSLPAQPIRSPAQPVSSPPQPVSSPAQPIRSPAQPVSSPAQPIHSPAQPVSLPAQPICSPAQPIHSPAQPVSLPAQPIRSPAQPIRSSAQPVSLPSQEVRPPTQVRSSPAQPVLQVSTQSVKRPVQPTSQNAPFQSNKEEQKMAASDKSIQMGKANPKELPVFSVNYGNMPSHLVERIQPQGTVNKRMDMQQKASKPVKSTDRAQITTFDNLSQQRKQVSSREKSKEIRDTRNGQIKNSVYSQDQSSRPSNAFKMDSAFYAPSEERLTVSHTEMVARQPMHPHPSHNSEQKNHPRLSLSTSPEPEVDAAKGTTQPPDSPNRLGPHHAVSPKAFSSSTSSSSLSVNEAGSEATRSVQPSSDELWKFLPNFSFTNFKGNGEGHFTSVHAELPAPPLSDFYDGKFKSEEQFFAYYGQKCFDEYCKQRPTAKEMFDSISPPIEWPEWSSASGETDDKETKRDRPREDNTANVTSSESKCVSTAEFIDLEGLQEPEETPPTTSRNTASRTSSGSNVILSTQSTVEEEGTLNAEDSVQEGSDATPQQPCAMKGRKSPVESEDEMQKNDVTHPPQHISLPLGAANPMRYVPPNHPYYGVPSPYFPYMGVPWNPHGPYMPAPPMITPAAPPYPFASGFTSVMHAPRQDRPAVGDPSVEEKDGHPPLPDSKEGKETDTSPVKSVKSKSPDNSSSTSGISADLTPQHFSKPPSISTDQQLSPNEEHLNNMATLVTHRSSSGQPTSESEDDYHVTLGPQLPVTNKGLFVSQIQRSTKKAPKSYSGSRNKVVLQMEKSQQKSLEFVDNPITRGGRFSKKLPVALNGISGHIDYDMNSDEMSPTAQHKAALDFELSQMGYSQGSHLIESATFTSIQKRSS